MREALKGFEGGVEISGVKGNIFASEEKGLLLNTKKTKIMMLDKDDTGSNFLLDGQNIEVVHQFEYPGSLINTKSDSSAEIKRTLAIARKTLQNMSNTCI